MRNWRLTGAVAIVAICDIMHAPVEKMQKMSNILIADCIKVKSTMQTLQLELKMV